MEDHRKMELRTARMTGFWYLMMAVSGILGFLIFHPKVYASGDAAATLENLINGSGQARIRLLLEFAIILTQSLTAVWFYKLFRPIDQWAAFSVAVWGTVNAVAITISAIAMATAMDVAGSALASADQLTLITLLQGVIKNAWAAGSIFFGLWLIPMGYIVIRSGRMPLWLGRILIVGGIGYMLSTLLYYAGVNPSLTNYLTFPATIGEFWMIGYLLVFGIRDKNTEA